MEKYKNLAIPTPRCTLIPFQKQDEAIFLEINTEPFVRRYLWDDEIIAAETANEILRQNQDLFENSGYGLWKMVLNASKEVAGYAGLWYFFDEPQPQLLYVIREAYSGKGLATEAAQAVMDYAFASLGFKYLLAATDEPHVASQQVALRLGMTQAERRVENGKPTLFYRIDKKDYRKIPIAKVSRRLNEQLMAAIASCDVQAVEICLTGGADPNYIRPAFESEAAEYLQPNTPLRLVVFCISDSQLEEGKLAQFGEIATRLLQSGADPGPAMQLAELRYGKYDPAAEKNPLMDVWHIIAGAR